VNQVPRPKFATKYYCLLTFVSFQFALGKNCFNQGSEVDGEDKKQLRFRQLRQGKQRDFGAIERNTAECL